LAPNRTGSNQRQRRTREESPKGGRIRPGDLWRDDRRYIVRFNPDEADKDRQDREAIVAALEKALAQGDKSLVGN
jgi:hypothetical protein